MNINSTGNFLQYLIYFIGNYMIKIIVIDKLNKNRAESCIYQTTNSAKASKFIQSIKNSLIYNQWEIKTVIGE
jgi:hypothetical protein